LPTTNLFILLIVYGNDGETDFRQHERTYETI
jgi:hypothetical protein